jgi:site-specific DNA recombinase
VIVEEDRILLQLDRRALARSPLAQNAGPADAGSADADLRAEPVLVWLVIGDATAGQIDAGLASLLSEAFAARRELLSGSHDSIEAMAEALGAPRGRLSSLLRLSYLSPQVVAAILNGRDPVELNRSSLLALSRDLPNDWREQGRHLGFASF